MNRPPRSTKSLRTTFSFGNTALVSPIRVLSLAGCIAAGLALTPSTARADTYTVTSTADAGPGTLRQALLNANQHIGLDTVVFRLTGNAPYTILINSALPEITDAINLDAATQPGYSGKPVVELRGGNTMGGSAGLKVTGGKSIIRGLSINHFGNAIVLDVRGDNQILGCFIGTDPKSLTTSPNQVGIWVRGANNRIGGTQPGTGCVISGNGWGIFFGINGYDPNDKSTQGNAVLGNIIGLDQTGTKALPNGTGIIVSGNSSNNTIGGTTAAASNCISGNYAGGIMLINRVLAQNVVTGNKIGTDITGTKAIGNGYYADGIQVGSEHVATITANLISGNDGNAVSVSNGARATIQGNTIGTDVSKTQALGNGLNGILIDGSSSNQIGGTGAASGNVIAFNGWLHGGSGVAVRNSSRLNPILGNSFNANSDFGIQLGTDAVPLNDTTDADTGPNDLQNFPLITNVIPVSGQILVAGTFTGKASQPLRIEIYTGKAHYTGFGQGTTYLGAVNVTTNAAGQAAFMTSFKAPSGTGIVYTATATDAGGNTSGFSPYFPGGANPSAPLIEFTSVSPLGSWPGVASGRVYNVGAGYKVAVYIHVPGYGWVNKPTWDSPSSAIDQNSHWTASITTGGSDQTADFVTAIVIPASYSPPLAMGTQSIPSDIWLHSVTSITKDRRPPLR